MTDRAGRPDHLGSRGLPRRPADEPHRHRRGSSLTALKDQPRLRCSIRVLHTCQTCCRRRRDVKRHLGRSASATAAQPHRLHALPAFLGFRARQPHSQRHRVPPQGSRGGSQHGQGVRQSELLLEFGHILVQCRKLKSPGGGGGKKRKPLGIMTASGRFS